MGGTTPAFAWPYPTGTDRVADGDNAIEALARAVETTELGGTAAVTPGSGITATAFAAYRRGRTGFLRAESLTVGAGGITAPWLIGTLPAGYWPVVDWRAAWVNWNANTGVHVTMKSANGQIVLDAPASVAAGVLLIGFSAYPLPSA